MSKGKSSRSTPCVDAFGPALENKKGSHRLPFLIVLPPLIPPFPSAPAGNLAGGTGGPFQDRW
ncbi:TPA: hypothetical protein ACXN3U_004184, partial [Stenotrophomonas maltophilia]